MSIFDLHVLARDPGSSSVLIALGAPASGAAQPGWTALIPFVLVLGIFYFVILLPMKKRQQKVKTFLEALKTGDRVITSGGIHGTLAKVEADKPSVQLQIAPNIKIEVSKAAIIGYQGQEPVVPEGNQS